MPIGDGIPDTPSMVEETVFLRDSVQSCVEHRSSEDQKAYLTQMEQKWWQAIQSNGVNDVTAFAAIVAVGSSGDSTSWWSYVASLGYNILQNIQLEIHNVRLHLVPCPSESLVMDGGFASTYGAITVSLDRLTVKTVSEVLPEQSVKTSGACKLIEVDGLCVKWAEKIRLPSNELTGDHPVSDTVKQKSTDDYSSDSYTSIYVLPPSRFSGRLRRDILLNSSDSMSDLRYNNNSVSRKLSTIEFDTNFGELELQLTCEVSQALLRLTEVVVYQKRLLERFNRRPSVGIIHGRTHLWWKYAAGELRPHLRLHLHRHAGSCSTSLAELAQAARCNVVYVKAYTDYLLRGLITAVSTPASALSLGSEAASCDDCPDVLLDVTQTEHEWRCQWDVEWSVGRIAALRLAGMRRAAAVLHRRLNSARNHSSSLSSRRCDSGQNSVDPPSSGSPPPPPQFQSSSDDCSASALPVAVTTTTTKSWYAWWRYSSWLDLPSFWGALDAEDSPQPAAASHSLKHTLICLLDELDASSTAEDFVRDPGGGYEEVASVSHFRLVCRVDSCSLRLTGRTMTAQKSKQSSGLICIAGQQIYFTLDSRPRDGWARFATSVHSFTVRDERLLVEPSLSAPATSEDRKSPVPLFPFVVFPRLTCGSRPTAEDFTCSPQSGLFWLAYEMHPPGAEHSLEVRADPLHVVYQPELTCCVIDFLTKAASVASPTLECSARLRYAEFCDRTQANLRSILAEPTSTDSAGADGWCPDDRSLAGDQRQQEAPAPSPLSVAGQRQPTRWRLQLDIRAPRLLLPDRFLGDLNGPDGRNQVTGLLCNFGHLRISNYLSADVSTNCVEPHGTSDTDSDDLYFTPCASPSNTSDNEEAVEANFGVAPPEKQGRMPDSKARLRTNKRLLSSSQLYESYNAHLNELQVLVGKLEDLESLCLWNGPLQETAPLHMTESFIQESAAGTPRLMSIGTSNLLSRLSLVDRFSVQLLFSRRTMSVHQLAGIAAGTDRHPPSFWLSVEPKHCVFQLSDVKIAHLLRCIRPDATRRRDDSGAVNTLQHLPQPDTVEDVQHQQQSSCAEEASQGLVGSAPLVRQRHLIVNCFISELVVQMELGGLPIAECRLQGVNGSLIRFVGPSGGYAARLHLTALSMPDALGGDYDLILSSKRDVRLNSSGQLQVIPIDSSEISAPGSCSARAAINSVMDPPNGHTLPLLDSFDAHQTGGTDIIRFFFDWAPQSLQLGTRDFDTDFLPQRLDTLTAHLDVDSLDVVGNPYTLRELLSLYQNIASLSDTLPGVFSRPTASPVVPAKHTESSKSTPSSYCTGLTKVQLSLGRLSVVAVQPSFDLRIQSAFCHKRSLTPALIDHLMSGSRVELPTIRPICLLTVNKLSFSLQSALPPALSLRVSDLHLDDLTHQAFHQCILATGKVDINQGGNTGEAYASTAPARATALTAFIRHFTYQHYWPTVRTLSDWLHEMNTCFSSSIGKDDEDVYWLSWLQQNSNWSVCLEEPLLVCPMVDLLFQAPHRILPLVLLARSNRLTLTEDTGSHRIVVNSLESATVDSYHCPPVKQLFGLAGAGSSFRPISVYRNLPFDCGSPGVQLLLQRCTELSVTVELSKTTTAEEQGNTWCLNRADEDRQVWSPAEGVVSEEVKLARQQLLLLVNVQLVDGIRLVLTRSTHELVHSLLDAQAWLGQSASSSTLFSEPSEERKPVSTEPGLAVCVHLVTPRLELDLLADLGPQPVPLLGVTVHGLALVASRWPVSTRFRASLDSLVVLNRLPAEGERQQRQSDAQQQTDNRLNCRIVLRLDRKASKGPTSNRCCVRWVSPPSCYASPDPISRSLHVAAESLDCRLHSQVWPLLSEFVRQTFSPSTASLPTVKCTEVGDPVARAISTNVRLVVGKLQLLLTRHSVGEEEEEANEVGERDLVAIRSQSVGLDLTLNPGPTVLDTLPADRQVVSLQSVSRPLDYLLEGRLQRVTISASHADDCGLYPDLLIPPNRVVPSVPVHFVFLRWAPTTQPVSGLQEKDHETADAFVYLRMPLGYTYVHFQAMLSSVIASLNTFVRQYDQLSRAHAATQGFEIETEAPASLRLLLDVVAQQSTVTVPCAPSSRRALICCASRLCITNTVLRLPTHSTTTTTDLSASGDGSIQRTERLSSQCPVCYSHAAERLGQTTTSAPTNFPEDRSTGCFSDQLTGGCEANVNNWLLVDDMKLVFEDATMHCAQYFPTMSEVPPHLLQLSTDTDMCLRLLSGVLCASPSRQGLRLRQPCCPKSPGLFHLFPATRIQLQLQRNLEACRCHDLPDWRLSGQLRDLDIQMTPDSVKLLFDLLADNFGGRLNSSSPVTSMNDSGTPGRIAPPRPYPQPPTYFPVLPQLQTVITGIAWSTVVFDFDLQDLQMSLALEEEEQELVISSPEQERSNSHFGLLHLEKGHFNLNLLSDGQSVTSIRFTKFQLMDDRCCLGSADSQRLLVTALSASASPSQCDAGPTDSAGRFGLKFSSKATGSRRLSFRLYALHLVYSHPWITRLLAAFTSAFARQPTQCDRPRTVSKSPHDQPVGGIINNDGQLEYELITVNCRLVIPSSPAPVDGTVTPFPNSLVVRPRSLVLLYRPRTTVMSPEIHFCAQQLMILARTLSTYRRLESAPQEVRLADVRRIRSHLSPYIIGQQQRQGGRRAEAKQSCRDPRKDQPSASSSSPEITVQSSVDSNTATGLGLGAHYLASRAVSSTPSQSHGFSIVLRTSKWHTALSPHTYRMMETLFNAIRASVGIRAVASEPLVDSNETDIVTRVTGAIAGRVPWDLYGVRVVTSCSFRWFTDYGEGVIPFVNLTIERFDVDWRCVDAGRGCAVASGLSLHYYNYDLLTWEPALEPWNCNVAWQPSTLDSAMTFTCHSLQSLNINVTAPLVLSLRTWLQHSSDRQRQPATMVSQDDTEVGHGTSAAAQGPTSAESTELGARDEQRSAAAFRILNKTGCIVWFNLLGCHACKPLSSAEPSWTRLDVDGSTAVLSNWEEVDTAVGDHRQQASGATLTPAGHTCSATDDRRSLVVQVLGWKPVYPILVGRLGVFFRTLERDLTVAETELDNPFFPSAAGPTALQLPSHTRLVIEVIRPSTDSLQRQVVLRSGLTVTNDLPTGHQLVLGIRPNSRCAGRFATRFTALPVPVCLVASGRTLAVPIHLAAWLSMHTVAVDEEEESMPAASLCFRPAVAAVPSDVLGTSSVVSRTVSTNKQVGYRWSTVCQPRGDWTVLEAGNEAEVWQDEEDAADSPDDERLYRLSDTEVVKFLDWTRLTQKGDLVETILISTVSSKHSQLGLLDATAKKLTPSTGLEPDPDWVTVKPPRPMRGLVSRRHYSLQSRRYYMCMTLVRDTFPPDPLWVGVAASHRANCSRPGWPKLLPGHHVTVGPLIRLTSLLPCDLVYYFTGTSVTGRLPPGQEVGITEISPMSVLSFGVDLDGFSTCNPLIIPPRMYKQRVLLRLMDTSQRPLELWVNVLSRDGGARHLTVSAVVWLINDSGLPLVFTQATSDNVGSSSADGGSLTATYSMVSGQTNQLAAGQWPEHEMARCASPLLFSYPNKHEGHLLRVRIGRGIAHHGDDSVRLHPVWSPSLSLDKTGVDMLQLKVVDQSNRPDLVYHVGVEVRPGHGRHAITTIVTFTARYLIENHCWFKVQAAQRYCPTGRMDTSAVVMVEPGCTSAFHWTRIDLDRLLCVRPLVDRRNFSPRSPSDGLQLTQCEATLWSGGFLIDTPHSFTLMVRLPPKSLAFSSSHTDTDDNDSELRVFLRVVVQLRSATFHVLIHDANRLPPPFRVENASHVTLHYQQCLANDASGQFLPANRSERNPPQASRGPARTSSDGGAAVWASSASLYYLVPKAVAVYGLEEPTLPPVLQVGVQSGQSAWYDLEKLGEGQTLIYDNFVYLKVLGPLDDSSASAAGSQESTTLVFDVHLESRRVLFSSKIPGCRSQLWQLSKNGYIFHEGSSSPLEPGHERSSTNLSTRQFVLDLDTSTSFGGSRLTPFEHTLSMDMETNSHFEVGRLIVAPIKKRRKLFQTWRIDQHGLLVNSALFCVQVYRMRQPGSSAVGAGTACPDLVGSRVVAARPRSTATRLVSSCITPTRVFTSCHRAGSGRLRVFTYLDGVSRVLRVEDAGYGLAGLSLRPTTASLNRFESVGDSRRQSKRSGGFVPWNLVVSLPMGVGVNVTSAFAEELVYASLFGINLTVNRVSSSHLIAEKTEQPSTIPVGASDGFNLASDVLSSSRFDTDDIQGTFADDIWTGEAGVQVVESSRGPVTCLEPVDVFRLTVGHIQVDNQLAGASLPVLLFPDSRLLSEPVRSVSSSRPERRRTASDTTRQRKARPGTGQREPQQPTFSLFFQRKVQSQWSVRLFPTLQARLAPVVIQAEEFLLLKLIQFGQHCLLVANDTASHQPGIDTPDERLAPRSKGCTDQGRSDLLWFKTFQLSSVRLRLSVQTTKKSLTSSNLKGAKRLLPTLMSFTDAEVCLGPIIRNHMLDTSAGFLDQLIKHYRLQLRAQAVNIFGSVDFLGNPIGLINDLTSGISGLVELDVRSLIRHVAHGVGDSTAKVAGSFSQLLNAISLDERHQHERAAILGVRPDAGSDLPEPLHADILDPLPRFPTDGHGSESLDDFELTRWQRDGGASQLEMVSSQRNWAVGDCDDYPVIAPLTAGFRGFVHGMVGGVTSMITQPYRGAQEDQFKGFVYGVGRGILGTVAKPLGGIFDLVSGAMTSLSEAALPSQQGRPRRRRPRRSGPFTRQMALQPYNLVTAVAQFQLHRLTLFTTSATSTMARNPTSTVGHLLEIGKEVVGELDGEEEAEPSRGTTVGGSSPPSSSPGVQQPISSLVQMTVDGAWLSETLREPECVLHVLPVQRTGMVAILTDRTLWCVTGDLLRPWVTAFDQVNSRQTAPPDYPPVAFSLSEHAYLMFMLPYWRLDSVAVYGSQAARQGTDAGPVSTTTEEGHVYLFFSGDAGVSVQRLRCDRMAWAQRLVRLLVEAQFHFVQAAFSLPRGLFVNPTSSNTLALPQRHGVPLIEGHPVALSFAPASQDADDDG